MPRNTSDCIRIIGAREHNLKNISLDIPRGKFVVVTGVSGSGKSTLAFDIVFAEGQRRFLDSMNAYARQFVEPLERPELDRIEGLPPTVSIEQRLSQGGGKSTVGTVTEVHQFLRLLFARLGTPYCLECDLPATGQSSDAIAASLHQAARQRGPLSLLAPVIRNRKGFHTEVATWAAQHGYRRLRADGQWHDSDQPFRLSRYQEHDVEVEIGIINPGTRNPSTHLEWVERALDIGKGLLFALDEKDELTLHSSKQACPGCGYSVPPLDPKLFSYHSSRGWCPECRGFGELFHIPDTERGARADAIEESWFQWQEGKRETCPECEGWRLNPAARAVRLILEGYPTRHIGSLAQDFVAQPPTIDTFSGMTVSQALELVSAIKLKGREREIARDILPEIRERLFFLKEVGLDYLQLGRSVTTLSGGENQRIRLAAQLGSTLSGVLYVLDEPTIGLHARDNMALLSTLRKLQQRGNSLIVVEHDEDTMMAADHIIDLGPGAGVEGGEIIATGTLKQLYRNKASLTGQALKGHRTFPMTGERRPVSLPSLSRSIPKTLKRGRPKASSGSPCITLHGATLNNLKCVSAAFPINRLTLVTGVSGSGKSTLVRECLTPLAKAALDGPNRRKGSKPGDKKGMWLEGMEGFNSVLEVDQTPIGRTPRSTPGTYVGFFDEIRKLFASTPDARMRGYLPGRFSFNSKSGRCPSCEGMGSIKMEMSFLPTTYTRCDTCAGKRFNPQTLEVRYHGKHIAEVMELSVSEALNFFAAVPKIHRALEALKDTGLDYLKLGQTSPTLSGGEAQRIKLVTHLLSGLKPDRDSLRSRRTQKLFILEEPTIGLHHVDVMRLAKVLHRLVDGGHTVIVIEHQLDLIAEADWILDLGPEGGGAGGELVACGTPESVAADASSHTGAFLRKLLEGKK